MERNDSAVRHEIHEFKFQTLNKQVQQILSCPSRLKGDRQGISEAPKSPDLERCFQQLPNFKALQQGQHIDPVTGQRVASSFQSQESLSSCSTTSIDSAPGPSSPPRAYILSTSATAQRASAVTITHRGSFHSRSESPVVYPAIPLRTSSSIPLNSTLIRVLSGSSRNGPAKIDQKGKGKAVEAGPPIDGMEMPLTVSGHHEGERTDDRLQSQTRMLFPDGNNINDGLGHPITLSRDVDHNGHDTSTEIASSSGIEDEIEGAGSQAMVSDPVGRDRDGGIS